MAAATLPAFGAARAAAPAVGKQNAGFYRYKVGDIEVTVVTDGSNTFKFADNHMFRTVERGWDASRIAATSTRRRRR